MDQVVYLGSREGYEAVVAELDGVADVRSVDPEPKQVAEALVNADGLLDASMKVQISSAMINSASRLKIVSCATTGADHIDMEALAKFRIPLRTLKEDSALLKDITPAAELSWALLLACARNLKGAFSHVENGGWTRESYPGVMLNGRLLGLVGCGRIGGWMARYAKAFGMSVLAYDPYQTRLPEGVESATLEELITVVDFLSIHVHLSDETRGLISEGLLERCKPGLIIVNSSRGAVLDEAAVLSGLKSGRISSCGVDVLDGEPDIASHPFVEYSQTHDNLMITPHCGGFSPDAVRVVCRHAAKKIRAVLQAK